MKRLTMSLLLIMLIILMASCNKEQSNVSEDSSMSIGFERGTYYDKNWNEKIGTYQYDVIPNKETAIEVATQIFNGMKKSSKAEKYVPQFVFYDEIDEIWIVSFAKEKQNSKLITVGDDCSIAIQKKDGRVLRIWFGE